VDAFSYSGTTCLEVSESIFEAVPLSAITVSGTDGVTISTSIFYSCGSSLTAAGSGIFASWSFKLSISSCCFRTCNAIRGFALSCECINGLSLSLSTIVYCSLAGGSHVLGAVYQRSGLANSSCSNTNFSLVFLNAAGGSVAALEVVGGTDYANDCCWSMTFSTIWNCSGTSIIYSSTGLYRVTSEPSKIVNCNFWRNTPSRSGALLHVYEVGPIVLFSYFSGNDGINYFRYVSESKLCFSISDCHFLSEVSMLKRII
jgi:hypothetical protein